mmetsp:Transcript_23339/g.57946  ORF Transcript_23339/g.57946 Transcript_23339/m.57946 type:complete len:100 (+) Transcript_23339:894-1193(+)
MRSLVTHVLPSGLEANILLLLGSPLQFAVATLTNTPSQTAGEVNESICDWATFFCSLSNLLRLCATPPASQIEGAARIFSAFFTVKKLIKSARLGSVVV